jgi:hypothetical protein
MANGDGYKSTQKMKGHHSYASQTQDSVAPTSDTYSGDDNVRRPKGPYQDGAKAGSGGAKSDPDGPAPASQPRKQTY